MKTVYINGSPKKKLSVSGYLARLQRIFAGGVAVYETLRNKNDHKRILESIQNVDAVVFCLPLFVDSAPSHVLAFMKDMEMFCKEKHINIKLYAISNGGFIEGNQNKALMQVFENFCYRCGITWGGGIGIGGGVMLNVLRILFFVFAAIFALSIILSGIQYGNWMPYQALKTFLTQIAEILFFHLGVLFCTIKMGYAIRKGNTIGVHYIRVLLPSFVLIIVADIFFTLTSILEGGIFRGWLSRK